MNTLAPIHNTSQAKRIHSWFMNVQDTWFLELRYKLHLNAKFNRLSWCCSDYIWWWRLYLYIELNRHDNIICNHFRTFEFHLWKPFTWLTCMCWSYLAKVLLMEIIFIHTCILHLELHHHKDRPAILITYHFVNS